MRIGTAGLVMTGSPNAASVGARIAPISSAVASGSSGKHEHADDPARRDRQEQPDPEQTADQGGIAPEAGDVDRRGIGEQHERERDLRHVLDRRRLDVEVHDIQHDRPEDDPHRDEHEGRTDRQAVETDSR